MPNIEILVRNRIARANYGERIVSNNTDYTVTFDFDEEWEATDRVARFEIEDGYVDVPFSGNSVYVPCLPATARQVNIGVYAGELHTTSAATVTVIPSVLGGSKIEYVPITDAGLADAKDLEDADTVRVYDVSQGKLYKATLEQLREQMGSSGGSNDHSKLENRDAADQHPISAITGLENALAKKQPSGEYLTQEDLQTATDTALAQAKASGEFDGITPTIGDNGNWYLGDTDTNKPSRGKSAYSYAVDGGYTGTEAEFAAKLAAEGLDKALYVVNITVDYDTMTPSADKTFEEITQAYNEGKYHIVLKLFDNAYVIFPLTSIDESVISFDAVLGQMYSSFNIRSDNKILFSQNALAFESTKLPNPYPLTFTGAVSETYDGSSAKTITIPSGGGEKEWRLLRTISIAETVASVSISQDDNGNAFEVEDIFIYAPLSVTTSANTQLIVRFNDHEGRSTSLNDFLGTTKKSLFYESYWSGMRVFRMGSSTYDFARVANNAAIVKLSAAPQKINKIDLALQGSTTFTAGTFYIYAR